MVELIGSLAVCQTDQGIKGRVQNELYIGGIKDGAGYRWEADGSMI